jgi:hypothetical protein
MKNLHRYNREVILSGILHLKIAVLFSIMLLQIFGVSSSLFASQSLITESEGRACLEKGKTKKQVEESAMDIARRNAIDNVTNYVKGGSPDSADKEQLLSLHDAHVNVINELEKKWTSEDGQECFAIVIQAEVIPVEKVTKRATRGLHIVKKEAEPVKFSATLNIEVWTDKTEYKTGDEVTIFLKGNKPFYARVIYKDASGNVLQLLPNPYRSNNYFEADTSYRVPSDNDRFKLEVAPPFGSEEIVVYASTSQLGEIELESAGDVYSVKIGSDEIARKTRGVGGVKEIPAKPSKPDQKKKLISEFSESNTSIMTKN